MTDLKDFKKAVLSTSNSGAKDVLKLSLKETKLFLSSNVFLRQYRDICLRSLTVGYFPACWRRDQIHFIYKNKGERSDAANWRPITIAPSLGKHLERLFTIMISPMNDLNYSNHAYISRRSCLTAIVKAQQKLVQAKMTAKIKYRRGKCISILSFDDISGAFESIDHELVCYAIDKMMSKEKLARLSDFLRSYLKRNSVVIDEITGTTCAVVKKFLNKTAPQGSLLSPTLWRIYDKIFSELYMENIELYKDANDDIAAISHIAYADDHITLVTFWVEENADDQDTADRMSEIFWSVRKLLGDATSQLGCGINPLKSENVAPKRFCHLIDTNFER